MCQWVRLLTSDQKVIEKPPYNWMHYLYFKNVFRHFDIKREMLNDLLFKLQFKKMNSS